MLWDLHSGKQIYKRAWPYLCPSELRVRGARGCVAAWARAGSCGAREETPRAARPGSGWTWAGWCARYMRGLQGPQGSVHEEGGVQGDDVGHTSGEAEGLEGQESAGPPARSVTVQS